LHQEQWLPEKKKAPSISAWGFCIMAPQPGLEPGTYGLTDNSVLKKAMFYAVLSVKNITVQ
jgi:hypothetical protein